MRQAFGGLAFVAVLFIGGMVSAAPITVNASWSATPDVPPAFFWSGLNVDNDGGPFTYTAPFSTDIYVTDDFLVGDVFEVFDSGVSLGTTSAPAGGPGVGEAGPAAAFADPDYSSGIFTVGPGSHSITIRTIAGLDSGRGYIQVLQSDMVPVPIPEPSTWAALASLSLAGLCLARRRNRTRK